MEYARCRTGWLSRNLHLGDCPDESFGPLPEAFGEDAKAIFIASSLTRRPVDERDRGANLVGRRA